MLYDFIAAHRDQLVAKAREKVATRSTLHSTDADLVNGVPLFLAEFSERLRQTDDTNADQIAASATRHGGELLRAGFTIGQVVHSYGDVCQAITELAVELDAQITNDNFRRLNLCLDIAIAEAVTEYARQREMQVVGEGVEHLGFLAHELRNLLNTATLAFEAVRNGSVGVAGSTGKLVAKSLDGMRDLVSRSLAEVRLDAGPPLVERVPVAALLEEVEIAAFAQLHGRHIKLVIAPVIAGLGVQGDPQIVASIVANLVQNACKFTREPSTVTLSARVTPDRVSIDVADECGGLPPGGADQLFVPFTKRGSDRTGLGLGLAICLKGAKALGGELTVRDVPGTGCVFTLHLRRSARPLDPQ